MKRVVYKKRYRFPVPNFRIGLASVLDVGGALALSLEDLYRDARTPAEVDARALAGDWIAIGQDIQSAIDNFEQEAIQTQ